MREWVKVAKLIAPGKQWDGDKGVASFCELTSQAPNPISWALLGV